MKSQSYIGQEPGILIDLLNCKNQGQDMLKMLNILAAMRWMLLSENISCTVMRTMYTMIYYQFLLQRGALRKM